MNNELLLRHLSAALWHPAHCCLAMWKEQKPISSDDNHVIQCFAALYLREKAVFQCHSGTGEYLLLSETQQEAEILPGWLFYSALSLQYTEMLKTVSIQIRIIVLSWYYSSVRRGREASRSLSREDMQGRCDTLLLRLVGTWFFLIVVQSFALRAEHKLT